MRQRFQSFVRIENYQGLIAGLALRHWKRLPISTKAWIDAEDFINEGLIFARFKVLPYYDLKTAAFTTILTIMLDQYFIRVVDGYRRQKRTPVDLPVQKTQLSSDFVLSHQSLVQMYWQSSPHLRKYLYQWFFSGEGVDRIRNSKPFRTAKKEFLKLAPRYGVTFDLCSTLLERRETTYLDNERPYDEDTDSKFSTLR